jgi:U3 small nucleolar RNA-associated protein 25
VARKPPDHRALFGGNTDDHFRMGIKITRGAVKLFADFYDCDVIVASPLALATRLAGEWAHECMDARGCAAPWPAASSVLACACVAPSALAVACVAFPAAESAEEGACDFLSSIEILVAERADVLLMQNWAHMATGQRPAGWSRMGSCSCLDDGRTCTCMLWLLCLPVALFATRVVPFVPCLPCPCSV